MGIANIINTAGGGGGGGSEIITNLVNSVDGAGLRLANQGYISCADVSSNRFGTNDFSVEFVLSQETNSINADIFISNFNSSNQAVDAAVIRWDVIQNDNIQLVFTNSSATETAYNFGYDPAPDLNEPTHYLVSADRSGNAVLYRNGAEIASVSIAASGSANVGNSGQPTVIGSPVNNFGVKGNVYRFRTYSKALSSDEAKNVFDRADVPTALVSNLLLDLDCAYANPTQSNVIQDRGPNNQDGTLNGTITQTNVIKQGNLTSLAVGTGPVAPADGQVVIGPGTGGDDPKMIVGGEGNAQLRVRHIDGKGSTNSDTGKLFLNHYSTSDIAMAVGGGDVSVGTSAIDANVGAKKMQLEGSASTSVGPEMLLHNPAQGGGAASMLTFGGKASGTEGYTAAIKATNTGTLTIGTSSASSGFSEPAADLTIDSTGLASFSNGVTVAGANNWAHISGTDSKSLSLADDAQIQLADNEAGAMMIHIYDRGSGAGAVIFATYFGQPELVAGSSTYFDVADTDGKYCVIKSSSSHDVYFKNRSGTTRQFRILVTAGVLDNFV